MKTIIFATVLLAMAAVSNADTFMKFGEAGGMQHVINLESGSMDTYVGFNDVAPVIPVNPPANSNAPSSSGGTYLKVGEAGGLQQVISLDTGELDTYIGFGEIQPIFTPGN